MVPAPVFAVVERLRIGVEVVAVAQILDAPEIVWVRLLAAQDDRRHIGLLRQDAEDVEIYKVQSFFQLLLILFAELHFAHLLVFDGICIGKPQSGAPLKTLLVKGFFGFVAGCRK